MTKMNSMGNHIIQHITFGKSGGFTAEFKALSVHSLTGVARMVVLFLQPSVNAS